MNPRQLAAINDSLDACEASGGSLAAMLEYLEITHGGEFFQRVNKHGKTEICREDPSGTVTVVRLWSPKAL